VGNQATKEQIAKFVLGVFCELNQSGAKKLQMNGSRILFSKC
jgi:uncharacterized protein YlxW (UPF0749 family)